MAPTQPGNCPAFCWASKYSPRYLACSTFPHSFLLCRTFRHSCGSMKSRWLLMPPDTRSCSFWPKKAGYTIVTALDAVDVRRLWCFHHFLLAPAFCHISLAERTSTSKSTSASWLHGGKISVSQVKLAFNYVINWKIGSFITWYLRIINC